MTLTTAPETTVSTARAFANSLFGLRDSSLLSDDFVCSGPRSAYEKSRYLKGLATESSALVRAIPDINFRPHAFLVDESDPSLVWFKVLPTGTLSGPLSYKGEVYLPNYETVDFPLQQLSVKVSEGKVSRVSAGYVIDRLSGNTGASFALQRLCHPIQRGWSAPGVSSAYLTSPLALWISSLHLWFCGD